MACFYGAAKAVDEFIEIARAQGPAALTGLLESRASLLRLPPISCCVGGARVLGMR